MHRTCIIWFSLIESDLKVLCGHGRPDEEEGGGCLEEALVERSAKKQTTSKNIQNTIRYQSQRYFDRISRKQSKEHYSFYCYIFRKVYKCVKEWQWIIPAKAPQKRDGFCCKLFHSTSSLWVGCGAEETRRRLLHGTQVDPASSSVDLCLRHFLHTSVGLNYKQHTISTQDMRACRVCGCRQICKYVCMYGWMHVWIDGRIPLSTLVSKSVIAGWYGYRHF